MAEDATPRRAQLRAELRTAQARIQRLERELQAVRSSTSFRLGHRVVRTASRLAFWRRPSSAPPSPLPRSVDGEAAAARPASLAAPSAPRRGSGRRVEAIAPDRLLVDATALSVAAAAELTRRLTDRGYRPVVVVYGGRLRLDDVDAEVVRANELPADLAARFGPTNTVRAVDLQAGPVLLGAGARPLQHVVDDLEGVEGLPPGPVFVGGTGRSGTWALGRMLGAHPRVVTVRTELRLHSSRPGFAEVLSGELSPEAYAQEVADRWMRIEGAAGRPKGLYLLLGGSELRQRLAVFQQRAADDVPGALAQLLHDIVDPYVRGRGGIRWVETTPDNARAAATLTTVFPTARVVNIVRDGRDVAASVTTMPWGPETPEDGLRWWARRVRQANDSLLRADAARVHTLRLEELIHLDRRQALDELLAALDYRDDEPVRAHFEAEMDGARANVGRWRDALDPDRRAAFDGAYREILAEMEADGVRCLPVDPDEIDRLQRTLRATPASDPRSE